MAPRRSVRSSGELGGAGAASEAWFLVGIILLAVALRVLFHIAVFHPLAAEFGWEQDDNYDEIARSLLAGDGYVIQQGGAPNLVRPPLYPLFLAGLFALGGTSRWALLLVQSLLQGLTGVVLYSLARRLRLDRGTARAAALLWAVYPLAMLYASQYATESLHILLLATFVWAFVGFRESAGVRRGAGMGALLGVATLTRPVTLFLPLLLPWPALHRGGGSKRAAWRGWAVACATFALVLLPWTVRNYAVSGKVVPVASRGAHFLYHRTVQDRQEEDATLRALAASPQGPENLEELDRRLLPLALANIARHPLQFVGRIGEGMAAFWYRGHSATVSLGDALVNLPLVLLGLLGAIGALRAGYPVGPLLLVVGYFMLAHAALHPMARYAVPVIPYVLLLAAWRVRTWTARWGGA